MRTPDTQATLRILAAATELADLVQTPVAIDGMDTATTPLMLAALAGQLAQVELLLQNGAPAGARNEKGMTAAQLAGEAGHEEVYQWLALVEARGGKIEEVDEAPVTIGKSGFVYKRGGSSNFWRRRWFVLDASELRYFKARTDTEPAGTVRVADMERVSEGTDPTREFYFQLATRTGRTYQFATETERQMHEWIHVFAAAIAQHRLSTGACGGPPPLDGRIGWLTTATSGGRPLLSAFDASPPPPHHRHQSSRWTARTSGRCGARSRSASTGRGARASASSRARNFTTLSPRTTAACCARWTCGRWCSSARTRRR